MAKSSTSLTAEFKSFNGINIPLCHSGTPSIQNIENFETDESGALKKRCGYRHFFNFPEGDIKCIWSGKIAGKYRCYVLIGRTLYNFIPTTFAYTVLGELAEGTEEISFFYYLEDIYLKDGRFFYLVEDTKLIRVEGYVPLYGKDWGTTYPGKVFEPLNLMNKKARISYVVGEEHTAMLATQMPVKSVISLYRDGERLDPEQYSIDKRFNTINIREGVSVGQTFYLTVEFDDSMTIESNYLNESPYAKVLGAPDSPRLAIWGSKENKTYLYITTTLTEEQLEASEKECPGNGHLYFKLDTAIRLGNGSNGITAVARNYDKLMLFTETETWISSEDVSSSEDLPLRTANHAFGCNSNHGITNAGSDTVAISYQGVIRWSPQTDVRDMQAQNISRSINRELSHSFLKNAIVYNNVYKNQLWLLDPQHSNVAWIYGIDNDVWFKFTGFENVKRFFDLDGITAFYSGSDIYVFSDDLVTDVSKSGELLPIVSKFESGLLSFGSLENKRMSDFFITADLKGDPLHVFLEYDTGENTRFSISDGDIHSIIHRRLRSARFKDLRVSLSARGKSKQVIHYLKLCAKEK